MQLKAFFELLLKITTMSSYGQINRTLLAIDL